MAECSLFTMGVWMGDPGGAIGYLAAASTPTGPASPSEVQAA
jgi:hypothetical protein